MKILLVNDNATLFAGAEVMVLTLRDGLRQMGHDARFFSSSARPGGGESLADYECFGTTSRFRTLLQTANPWAFWQLRRVLAEFRPDVVHIKLFLTQLSPLILPLLRDVPSLYHAVWYRSICPLGAKVLPDGSSCQVAAGTACYHNGCLPWHDWLPLMLQMQLWRRWRHAFKLIVANSEAVKRRLMVEDFESVEVAWNGVPTRPARPLLASPPTVACAAQLVRNKGVDVLIKAFAKVVRRVPEGRLLLAGAGPEEASLKELVDDLDLSDSVSMLGYLSRDEMERRFDAAWVQAVPSRWTEPFGLVAAEAMMRGTAVVASAAGGLVEIVRDDQSGLLVPPGNVDALAEALLRLLRDRELAERMGKVGRQVALEHFSQVAVTNRFVQLYQRLCCSRGYPNG